MAMNALAKPEGLTQGFSKGQGPLSNGRPGLQGSKTTPFNPAERTLQKGSPPGGDKGILDPARSQSKQLDSVRTPRGGENSSGSSPGQNRRKSNLGAAGARLMGVASTAAAAEVKAASTIVIATACDEASQHLVDLRRDAHGKELKIRRDAAFATFEATTRNAHAECEEKLREDLKKLRKDLAKGDADVEETFAAVKRLGDGIRNYKRGDVDAVLDQVVGLCQQQQQRIDEFTDMGEGLEATRRAAVEGALRDFVDETRDIIPIRGDVQRAVDKRGHDLNELTQLNRKAVADLTCRLQTAGLDKQKLCKRRWYNDVLLMWREHSHRQAIAEVLNRIEGDGRMEFLNPEILVRLFERLQDVQKELWETRNKRAMGALTAGLGNIKSKEVKQMQEELGNINEKFQDQFDKVFNEFKDVKDQIANKAQQMLKELAAQLKELDARHEWHGHDSVDLLLAAELQPKVDENLKFVNTLMMRCSQDLQVLDDLQHNSTVNLLQFIIKSAEASEKFKSAVTDFGEMEIDGNWQDMLEDHEEEKQKHTDILHEIQIEIEQAVDVPQLDLLAQKAFDHLDVMSQSHSDFYNRQVEFLSGLPERTEHFFIQKVECFLPVFGLRSLHGLSGWEPPPPPEEKPAAPDVGEGAEGAEGEGAEGAEAAEPEAVEEEPKKPEPKLTDVELRAGVFEVSGAIDEECNGAYVHYVKVDKNAKKSKSKSGKGATKDEKPFVFPQVFVHTTLPKYEIRYVGGEWHVSKGESKIHAAPKDVFHNADLRKCMPETEGEGKVTTAVRGPWEATNVPSEVKKPKKGEEAEEPPPPPIADVVWRPLCEGDLGPPSWAIGSLFTDRSQTELVLDLVRPPEEKDAGDAEGVENAEAEEAADAAATEEKNEAADGEEQEEKSRVPVGADGKPCLLILEYTVEEVRKLVEVVRTGTMTNIAQRHRDLTASLEEKIKDRSAEAENTLFDQRRRHVSRRGVVQVEWYAPRKGVVERHKESFQRLLHGIAIQVQNLDKTFEEVKEEFVEARSEHEATLTELTTKFEEATSVAQFSKLEREAEMSKLSLDAKRKKFMDSVMHIATHDIDQIRENTRHFLARCHVPVEQYSPPELKIYKKEVANVISQLVERSKQWKDWVEEQDSQEILDELNAPLADFDKQVHAAIEKLSEEKGLGRKHGVVRRAMQQQLQTLMSYTTTSIEHLHSLVDWCAHVGEGKVPDGVDPAVRSRVAAALNAHPPKPGEGWPVALEVRALLTVIGLAVRLTGGFLTAWKSEHESAFAFDKLPHVCFVREDVALGGADADGMEELKKVEDAFKHEVIIDLFGRIRKSEPLAVEAKKVRESVSAHYKGGVPQFMEAYLAHTHKLEHNHRLQLSLELKDLASGLRGEVLCDVVARAFTDLARRQQEALEAACKGAEKEPNEALSRTAVWRRRLDDSLGPHLARPNMAHVLEELCVEEKDRHKTSVDALKTVRTMLGEVFRHQAKAFLKALVAQFEAIVTLVDALPLPTHFAKLEDDEAVNTTEDIREEVSIKRRMRRQAGSRKPEDGALPQRVWEGVPMDEIRVDEKIWPEDEATKKKKAEAEAEAAEKNAKSSAAKGGKKAATKAEDVAGDSPGEKPVVSQSMNSYRSPLHKQLFRSRNACYDQFCKLFNDAMNERHANWSHRDAQEEDLVRSWKLNIKQLKRHSEANEEVDSEEEAVVEEEPRPPTS
eukprot:gnl/MRDRNA2_/MRDRNA2_89909_c0_seq1.p1 gnl/MRDRNA2_/MRDRNA2_89909_c0~~gnl/MRDRNA2_/MRDRNA2_89909_c0_seq1.p1  ORF type:complete len:1698 (+),score=478.33 gnl/MRDRNA2_/MRDRNA2_89909_c0_seq1:78-5171(+)